MELKEDIEMWRTFFSKVTDIFLLSVVYDKVHESMKEKRKIV